MGGVRGEVYMPKAPRASPPLLPTTGEGVAWPGSRLGINRAWNCTKLVRDRNCHICSQELSYRVTRMVILCCADVEKGAGMEWHGTCMCRSAALLP